MPRRTAIGISAVVLIAIIVAAGVGILVMAAQTGTHSSTTQSTTTSSTGTPVSTTIVTAPPSSLSSTTTNTTSTATCYAGTLPVNGSSSAAQAYSRTVFNVTKDYNSWSWTSLSTFEVGSYTFVTTNPATTPGVFQLEPQLFFNVTNSQGQTQKASFTNLGGWNGQVWPPDMGLQAILFTGNVTIQWLFQCNSQNVFLEVTTQ